MSSDLSDLDCGRAAGATRARGWPSTCPRAGWRRSTPATPRRVPTLAGRSRLREVVHRVRRVGLRDAHLARRVRRRALARARAGPRGERGAQPLPSAAPGQHHRHRHGRTDGDRVGERGAQAALPRAASPPTRRSGASSSASRAPAPTSPDSRHAPSATATSGWSTARRSGRRSRTWRATGCCSARTDPDQPEAPRSELLRRRHAPTRRRGAAAAPDHRRRRVQRGVLRERARSPTRGASDRWATAGGSRSPR